ncbi:hypothetical protein OSSY52_03020 [Tepiditoga spiralis]|uniref:Fibronectin type-III domain-containing protein n=1 Tax=Tepiditoga spiralis TaxID=2108365 RepID=A0A7G1G1K3_9BACT|nr:hypothetical protein [Tepiditoga spiralis]BBE30161.1 hypothetical protein OSSY52_03020 [Tepiditoga spiralis]
MKKLGLILFVLFSTFIYGVSIQVISPKNNDKNVDIKSIFRWNIDEKLDIKYDLFLSKDISDLNKNIKLEKTYSNFYAGDVLEPNTTYYWKVIGYYEDNKIESNIFKFKTRNLKKGDISWIFFGNYKNVFKIKDMFIGIKETSIDIIKDKNVIFTKKYKDKIIDVSIKDKIYVLFNNTFSILDFKLNEELLKKFNDTFIKIQDNFILSKNGIYQIYDDNIEKISDLNAKKIIKVKDKIYVFTENYCYLLKNNIKKNVYNLNGKYVDSLKLFQNNNILVMTNNGLTLYNPNFEIISKYDFQIKYDSLKRKIFDFLGTSVIISGDRTLIFFDSNLQIQSSKTLNQKIDYFVPINKKEYIVFGESIKSYDISGKTLWYYGSINSLKIVSKPRVYKNSVLVGIKDYVTKYIEFYDFFDYIKDVDSDLKISIPTDTTKNSSNTNVSTKITLNSSTTNISTDTTKNSSNTNVSTKITLNSSITNISTDTIKTSELSTQTINKVINTLKNNKEINKTIIYANKLLKSLFENNKIKIQTNLKENINTRKFNLEINSSKIKKFVMLLETKDSSLTTIVGTTTTLNLDEEKTYTLKLKPLKYKKFIYVKTFKTTFFNIVKEFIKPYDQYSYGAIADNDNFYMYGYEEKNDWNAKLWIFNKYLEPKKEMTFGGPKTEFFKDAIITHDSTVSTNIILVGDTTSVGLNGNAYMVNTTTDGTVNYETNYGDIGRDSGIIVKNIDENNYIMGGNIFVNNRLSDIFLTKYTNEGTRIWINTFGGKSIEILTDVLPTKDNGFLVVGMTKSFGYGGYDVYGIKLNYYGKEVWSNTYGDSNDDKPVGFFKYKNTIYIFYENYSDTVNHCYVKISSKNGFGSSVRIKSNYNEKINGIKNIDGTIYLYGYREENNMKNGIIYTLNVNEGTLSLVKKYENFEITSLSKMNTSFYISGNTLKNNSMNLKILKVNTIKDEVDN